ncbi:hypothetical protein [Kineosporia babensis]|uniref:Uncharacterized protein n=1 Tax=Kineosporia babensis TaxID=499548 RepID=A0A9X1NB70_9ACTN|nr:hypothetical protein [Kineosporia babensis]MCD5310519.1 hypothetical protein [Kineosporia babensis]
MKWRTAVAADVSPSRLPDAAPAQWAILAMSASPSGQEPPDDAFDEESPGASDDLSVHEVVRSLLWSAAAILLVALAWWVLGRATVDGLRLL